MVEQSMITTALQQYNVTDAVIAKYKSDYMALTVKSVEDKEGYDLCHAARMEVKGKRVEVEKTRKKLKEDALEYGRAVDKEAKRITALLEPIEDHLTAQEKIIDDEKARIKAEAEAKEAARIQLRIDSLFDLGMNLNRGYFSLPYAPEQSIPEAIVKTCPDNEYAELLAKITVLNDIEKRRIEKEAADKKVEEERLAKVRAEQEAEAARLNAIAEEQRKKEAAIKAEQDAIEKEKLKIEHEKQIEIAKKEAAEKAVKDAEAKRLKEEKEKAEKVEQERIEAEKKAALAPDKEKLNTLAASLYLMPTYPEMKTDEGKEVLSKFRGMIDEAIKYLHKATESL